MPKKRIYQLFFAILVAFVALGASAATSVRNGVTLLGVDGERLTASIASEAFTAAELPQPAAKQKAPQHAPAISEIAGYYYTVDYGTSTPVSASRKYMVQISALGTDSVEIYNLIGGQQTVKGYYDATAGTITLKAQVTYVDDTYGSLYCCYVDWDKKTYYPNGEIVISVNDNGNMTMPCWGIFVLEGTYKGRQVVNSKSLLYKANAMITDYSLSQTVDSLKVRTYPACYSRESKTQVAIRNFYNTGSEVTMTLDTAGNVTMPHQQIATSGTYNYYNYCITSYTTASDVTLKASGLTGTFVDSVITVGPWACSRSTAKTAIVESLIKSEIRAAEAFTPFSTALTLSGSGTSSDPYLIQTAEDLEALANSNNHNDSYVSNSLAFSGIYFKQTADIDMKNVENHEPIGIDGKRFNGNYDGQGHTISNLQVNRRSEFYCGLFGLTGDDAVVANIKFTDPLIECARSKVGTVVGENRGTVSDITVTGGTVTNPSLYAGGIVGMNYGTVANASYSGSVEGETMIGGIVGVSYGTISSSWSDASVTLTDDAGYAGGVCGSSSRATTVFNDCYFTGTVTDSYGGGQIGGVLGHVSLSTLNRCWNGGIVAASATTSHTGSTGGVVGYLLGGQMNDCYNSGIVRSYTSDVVGGLVGTAEKGAEGSASASDAPIIKNCLHTGMVFCSPSVERNELIGVTTGEASLTNSYFDNQVCVNGSTDNGLATASLTAGTAINGFDSQVWSFTAGKYPQLSNFTSVERAKLDAEPFTLTAGETVKHMKSAFTVSTGNSVKWYLMSGSALTDTGHGLTISGNNVNVTATAVVSDTLAAILGDYYRVYVLKVVPDEFDGTGTADDPYIIKTKADFDKIKQAVDVQLYDYTGVHFKVANDIDMGGDTGFYGLSVNGTSYAFNGTINGDGHSITNWQVNRCFSNGELVSGTASYPAALFFYTGKKSVITGLNVASDCSITAGAAVASLVASNSGVVSDCRNYADVTAVGQGAAGLVAINNGKVERCYNAGTILSGSSAVGGIVAQNNDSVLLCQNDGLVAAKHISTNNTDTTLMKWVGGIVGYNTGVVADAVSNGQVSGAASVGGIAGCNYYAASLNRTLTTAPVICWGDKATTGAVIGSNSSTGVTANNYYDSQLSGETDGNAIAIDGIDGLATAELVGGDTISGLPAGDWTYTAGSYPVLTAFASEPASLFNSQAYLKFVSGEKTDSRFSVTDTAQIVTPQGATAALKVGKDFTISGSTLCLGALAEATCDTLTITSGTLSKSYPLFAAPKMLPNGDGSATNPWRLATVEDWMTVANYSLNYSSSFENEYFLLVNDIDFKGDTTFLPLVSDGATRFQGYFDGNGKTLDGINCVNTDTKTGIKFGIFGLIGENGVVENLTLGDSCVIQGHQYIGGFAGLSSGLIRNCTNRATVSTSKMGFVGGFVGTANASARFIGCKNYGTVTSSNGQAGGIVGSTDEDVTVDSCYNAGVIDAKYSCGGIIGSSKAETSNCLNEGAVTTTTYNAGGVIGYQDGIHRVADCVNKAAVTATTYNGGGIVGNVFKASSFVRCANYGDVSVGSYVAGGVAGTIVASATIDTCVNYGNVLAAKYSCGGIVGATKSGSAVNASFNYGNVAGAYNTGGIVGNNAGSIYGCFNGGTVEAGYALGGVAGTGAGPISASGNVGDVMSTGATATTAYNVGGVLGTGKAVLTDVYNMGAVSGYKQVGGIIGLPVKGTTSAYGTTVTRAYNVGSVICATADNVANCGNVYGSTGIKYVKFDSIYYDTQWSTELYANDSAAVALPTAGLTALDLGDTWTYAAHSYPVPACLADSSMVRLYSAALEIDSLDTRDAVTRDFYVGTPGDVVWTVSDNLNMGNGGRILLANSEAGETATLTASCGGREITYTITLITTSSVDEAAAQKPVSHIEYVGVNGVVYDHPVEGVNIVRTVYTDGTSSTVKVLMSRTR